MPDPEPPDDFSRLPNAQSASGLSSKQRLWQQHAGRAQTRIGPKPAEEQAPAAEPSAAWQELLHEGAAAPADLPMPPPARPPRRTVIASRAGPSEALVPATDEAPPPVEVPPQTLPADALAAQIPTGAAHAEEPSSGLSAEPSAAASALEAKAEDKAEDKAEGLAAAPAGFWRQRWEAWGGRALSVSLTVHAVLLLGAAWVVISQVRDPQIDFLPGGGTQQGAAAAQALEHRIQQKKSPWLKKSLPVRKIAAVGSISDVVLPDEVPDMLDLPEAKSLLSGAKLGAGMGLAGAGGGFGKAMGLGGRDGMVFQPLSMFGMQIRAKRLALVLDVSTSMAPHLPRVIEEVDKVARGSVVVLYFGCGLVSPQQGRLEGADVYPTSGVEFERFWRMGGASLEEARKFRFSARDAIPSEEIYRMLAKRPQTYFIHSVGTGYAWLALLSDQVRSADGLYWFSDFQDQVNFQQVEVVRENLQRRKQRLYMHAYMRGSSFDLVNSQLVQPTGGDVKLED